MSQHTQSEGHAAPGILGSTLLSNDVKHLKTMPAPASAGCAAIDTLALDGGFRYGEITSIAGAKGMGNSLVRFNVLRLCTYFAC